jgi:DNA-binding MarR family transcriptional regulator
MASKTLFATLPLRALSDATLSALDLRVLAVIGLHDRLSRLRGKGAGCWAGNETLARECNCRLDSLSVVVTRLKAKGYILRDKDPTNRRKRVYRVVHDDRAAAQLSNGKGGADSLAPAQVSATKQLGSGVVQLGGGPTIVGRANQEVVAAATQSGLQDNPEYSPSRNSLERPPLRGGAPSEGADQLGAPRRLTADEIEQIERDAFGPDPAADEL